MTDKVCTLVNVLMLSCVWLGDVLSYKAAVFEHDVIFPSNRSRIVNRTEALGVMAKNLRIYKEQCQKASAKGAQIIVFPEYGLYGLGWSRQTIVPYLEYIPDPQSKAWNPCLNPSVHKETDIQQHLSCTARSNHIYVVANMGAAQPCDDSDTKCPDDGIYQHSANVVYDSDGFFVARYFKQHLNEHEKDYLNKPPKVDYTVFNTTFGLFGTFSSLDVLFHEPTITLIEQMKVDNIVYPTAWRDELPLLAAIEFHSAFSMRIGIKLLAANLHRPAEGYHGSGMYWPMGTSNDGVYYYNDSINSPGQLLVHETGSNNEVGYLHSNKNFQRSGQNHKTMTMNHGIKGRSPYYNHKIELTNKGNRIRSTDHLDFGTKKRTNLPPKIMAEKQTVMYSKDTFKAEVNHDLYTLIPVRASADELYVCQGAVCCSAGYEGMNFENTTYAFGAFDGMHTHEGPYYLQACTFIQCANNSLASCGQPTNHSTSYMDKMSFEGNFTTKYVYPEVLVTYGNTLNIVTKTWLYQESIIIDVGVPGGPLSISMYARDYKRDQA